MVDTVIMGDAALWTVKQERDAIYAQAEMSEADGMRVGDLESQFAEMDGYSAESRAAEILIEAGIDEALHYGLMEQVAPGWKLRVLLAQALLLTRKFYCWMSQPTTWISTPSAGWKPN